jgi:ATP-dependent RNA helicase RhlE
VSNEEAKQLKAIEREVGVKLLPETVKGFAPSICIAAPAKEESEDIYGNFEADAVNKRTKPKKRTRRGRK